MFYVDTALEMPDPRRRVPTK